MTDTLVHALIPFFTVLPLAAAFLIPLIAANRESVADWLANLTLFALVIIGIVTFGEHGLYEVGGWSAPIGIVLRLDPLASLMLVSVAGVAWPPASIPSITCASSPPRTVTTVCS